MATEREGHISAAAPHRLNDGIARRHFKRQRRTARSFRPPRFISYRRLTLGRGLIVIACGTTMAMPSAQEDHGVGIANDSFSCRFAAGILRRIVSWRNAVPLENADGNLGVLIGSDHLNLASSARLVASIGGAGTFDGIFVTGLFVVRWPGLPAGGRRGGTFEPPHLTVTRPPSRSAMRLENLVSGLVW